MSIRKPNKPLNPFGLSSQQIQRLQQVLDANGKVPWELAGEWGVSVDAVNKDFARMRVKADANSLTELLIKVQRTGAISITPEPNNQTVPLFIAPNDHIRYGSGDENVYCRVLDSPTRSLYNVPIMTLTRLSRIDLAQRRQMAMENESACTSSIKPRRGAALAQGPHQIDGQSLAAVYDTMREANNRAAIAVGLPAVGSTMINKYGIEWVVDSHVHVPTPNTVHFWRQGIGARPDDLYPSIIPQNLSQRLTNFIAAVDRCTAKSLILLDTTPELRPMSVPGANSIDTISNGGANLVFLDAARLHETVLAHEIGHAWVQYVDECEDERVMEDVSDSARLHQLSFVQSFVLDMKVNDVIRRKGFDMSPIEEDQAASIASLCRAIQAGYRPPNQREEVFMALLLATQMLDEARSNSNPSLGSEQAIAIVRHLGEHLASLARGFAEAVQKHGHQDRLSIRNAIDECLMLAFDHTGDGFDLDNDLVVPDAPEPNFDKYPKWIEGAPVALKVDVGKIMAREDIPNGSRYRFTELSSQTLVEFLLSDGTVKGPWLLNHPYPFSASEDALQLMEANRRNREQMMNRLGQTPPAPRLPDQASFPPFGGRRHYMVGLGRFLTQARLEERMRGDNLYVYAYNNPVTRPDVVASQREVLLLAQGIAANQPHVSSLTCLIAPAIPGPCDRRWDNWISLFENLKNPHPGNSDPKVCQEAENALKDLCKYGCILDTKYIAAFCSLMNKRRQWCGNPNLPVECKGARDKINARDPSCISETGWPPPRPK